MIAKPTLIALDHIEASNLLEELSTWVTFEQRAGFSIKALINSYPQLMALHTELVRVHTTHD